MIVLRLALIALQLAGSLAPTGRAPRGASERVASRDVVTYARHDSLVRFASCAAAPCQDVWAYVRDVTRPGAPATWILTAATREPDGFLPECGGWAECRMAVAMPLDERRLQLVLPFEYRAGLTADGLRDGHVALLETRRAGSAIEESAPGWRPSMILWTWRDGHYERRGAPEPDRRRRPARARP